MAYSHEQRRRLMSAAIPESAKMRGATRDYMERAGLTLRQFAVCIGYSVPALSNFVNGKYERISSDSSQIRAAIASYMERHPLGAMEFTPGKLYDTGNVKMLRRYFYEALDKCRCGCVEGNPGTQKSFVAQHLVYELNQAELSKNGAGKRAYYIYCPPQITPRQLIQQIAETVGAVASGINVRAIVKNIRHTVGSRRALLLLDEAQHLDINAMETVRELHDLPPHFGLLFLGSHNFGERLMQNALQMEQWNSRFHFRKRLPGLDEEEAQEIIRAELGAKASAAVVKKLTENSKSGDLRSGGKEQYVSARKLFYALADLTEAS